MSEESLTTVTISAKLYNAGVCFLSSFSETYHFKTPSVLSALHMATDKFCMTLGNAKRFDSYTVINTYVHVMQQPKVIENMHASK